MNRLNEERQVILVYVATDLVLYWGALTVATLSRLDVIGWIDFSHLHRDRLMCTILFGIVSIVAGVYRPQRITDRFDSAYYACIALGWTCFIQFAIAAVLPASVREITRRELIIALFVAAPVLCAWHYFASTLTGRFRSLHRFFYILGSPSQGKRIAGEIGRNSTSVRAEAAYVDFQTLKDRVQDLSAESGGKGVALQDAIIALEPKDHWQLDELLLFCRENCRRTYMYPSVHDMLMTERHSLLALAGIPLIEVASQQLITPYTYIKRVMDVAAAALGLILSSPICLVTALAIKLTSPGGVIYSQERLGMGGKPFRMYKFRSMLAGKELKDEAGHVLAREDDPRITPVGRIIRRHRIDEIPQLFNVLKGDMSLIGPRPAWREFYEINDQRIPLMEQRLAVRPGLTCLSHVLGSYSSEPEDRLTYDLLYLSTLSFITDLRILVGTIRIVLSGKGAR
jgi:exopolysaccharide biosynthesis polyprenyl glycosylphosphotransferase